jgi:hypothetical protein
MEKTSKKDILDTLYEIVSNFDDLQEKVIKACLYLNKLEKEEELYHKMDMPDIFSGIFESLYFEKELLLKEKQYFEFKMELVDISEVNNLIDYYQKLIQEDSI